MDQMPAQASLRRGRESWTRRIEVALVLVGSVVFTCAATADECFPIEEPEPVVFDVGDLDGSQAVDFADVSLLLDHLCGEGPSVDEVIADVDVNGTVDLADAVALTWQGGATLDEARLTTFVTQLNELAVDGPPPGQGGGTQLGLLGCAWCWIRCFSYMNQAADCAAHCQAQYDACKNLDTVWDQCFCMADVRRNCMPNCLALVANAAGRCGSCVWKCAPRPSYR